jgi:hypothetical protein
LINGKVASPLMPLLVFCVFPFSLLLTSNSSAIFPPSTLKQVGIKNLRHCQSKCDLKYAHLQPLLSSLKHPKIGAKERECGGSEWEERERQMRQEVGRRFIVLLGNGVEGTHCRTTPSVDVSITWATCHQQPRLKFLD